MNSPPSMSLTMLPNTLYSTNKMISHKTNSEVRTMLERMYEILGRSSPDPVTAWDRLVEFIATDNCGALLQELDHKFEWLLKDHKHVDELMNVYDSQLLESDYHDYLGEMYLERIAPKIPGHPEKRTLVTMKQAERIAHDALCKGKAEQLVLDPCVGSGRFLLAAHKAAPKAILCGVDTDLRMLRIALTNCVIHNIPVHLLHADVDKHEIDISSEDGEYNWQYANKWYSCMNELKEKHKGGMNRQ